MACSKQQSSTLSLRREPTEQLPKHPMSVRRKLPLTAQVAAAYAPRLEEGLPSNISVGQTQRRGARAELRQLHVAGLSRRDGLRHRRRRCEPGARSWPDAGGRSWGPGMKAVGKHSQAQLWWRDAASRLGRQLSPADFLAGREHVDELRTEQRRHDELRR